jgi:hypothetical protein
MAENKEDKLHRLIQIITSLKLGPILFADDTSIIIYHTGSNYFQNSINDVFASLNRWFKVNKLIEILTKENS